MKLHAAFGFLLLSTVAAAAQTIPAPTEEVVIYAPYVIKVTKSGMHPSAPVQTVSISRQVSYHDLDLAKDEDVGKLEGRVRLVANVVCKDIRQRYPETTIADQDECARIAAHNALTEVEAIVDAVRRR